MPCAPHALMLGLMDARVRCACLHACMQVQVMGMLQGKIVHDTFVVIDSFALPVEGTETRVNAQVHGGWDGGAVAGWGGGESMLSGHAWPRVILGCCCGVYVHMTALAPLRVDITESLLHLLIAGRGL